MKAKKNKKNSRQTTIPDTLRHNGKIERPCPFNHDEPFFAPPYNLKRHMAAECIQALLETIAKRTAQTCRKIITMHGRVTIATYNDSYLAGRK